MELPEVETYVETHYRHNFFFNMLDGATFWLGYSFLAPGLILPLYASHFTDNNLLLGFIPAMGSIGYLLPQLFTSNWVQRLPRKKVLPVTLGLLSERLPIFLLAPATWLLAESSPQGALVALYVLYGWHVIGAGVIAVGWQDMIAKIIPANRRGWFFGITNFLGNGSGALGAAGAAWLLANYAFPYGYVFSFAAAALFIFISWICIAQTREPAVITHPESHSQVEYFRKLPAVVRADRNFRSFLLTQVVVTLGGLANGFLVIYAARRWNLPDSYAGSFTAVMLVGQALANLAFGPLADRKGHKLVLEMTVLAGLLAVGLAALAESPDLFYLIFALRGASLAGSGLSGIAITLEFSSPELRPTYIGLSNTLSGLAAILAPLAGGWLANDLGFQGLFAIAFGVGLFGFSLMRWLVHEPRIRLEFNNGGDYHRDTEAQR